MKHLRPRTRPDDETERFPRLVSDRGPAAPHDDFTGASTPGLMERHHTGPLVALPDRPRDVRPPEPRTTWQRANPQYTPAQAPETDRSPIAEWMASGWPHLFVIRCSYMAAPHATPIPCASVLRDPDAGSFRSLRRTAYAAGWHLDALGRMVCPRCVQESAEFMTLYPVTFWHADAAWLGQDDGAAGTWRTLPPRVEDYPVRPEFPLTVIAEQTIREDVMFAAVRGRHARAGAA